MKLRLLPFILTIAGASLSLGFLLGDVYGPSARVAVYYREDALHWRHREYNCIIEYLKLLTYARDLTGGEPIELQAKRH